MNTIVEKLKKKAPISEDESFKLAQDVTNALTDKSDAALNAIIYVLDNWDTIPQSTKEIWVDLIESVGFYPYIDKLKMQSNDFGFNLRKENHYSNSIKKYFHEGQAQLSNLIFSGKNVIASAPTSFGKSLLIEEIVAMSQIPLLSPVIDGCKKQSICKTRRRTYSGRSTRT